MKTLIRLAALASTLWIASPAFADEKAACMAGASKGQTLRDEHKLVEAREQFRVCARAVCPAAIQSDCASWLDAAERNLPTVVFTVKDAAGAPIVGAKVTVDEQPLAANLDGEAVPMDPGPHAFHFEAPDGTKLDQRVVVLEGQANQPIAVLMGSPPVEPHPTELATPSAPAEGHRAPPWRTVGWVAAGVGVLGLGLGATFGAIAIGDKSDAHCANNLCDAGPLSSARSAAVVSTVGLIAGGALLAGGVSLLLFAPHAEHQETAIVKVSPMVRPGGGGLVFGRTW